MIYRAVRPTLAILLALLVLLACGRNGAQYVELTPEVVKDKLKGGWVGQTVGVCFGAPTEFSWSGTWIQDYYTVPFTAESIRRYFNNDDLYMDLSFLAVLDSLGLDAPAEAMALKFANAGFMLWHANQAGRWNILHGVMPPLSGHWKHNPHADDIDFQIEADFIGLLTPGMPNTAWEYCDRVGHIMNYGDGVYGGLFVAAMYSQAFVEQDIAVVVEKALQSLPPQSEYARCIADVVAWWRQYPDDWHRTWFEVQRKWAEDRGCPGCVFDPGNIDAKLNGAYIAIGLLYGGGDMGRTIDISTRCGQDSDCNPSNAAGVLGTLLGFSRIPAEWVAGVAEVEALKFDHCNYSLNDVYEVNYRLAAELVERGGGQVSQERWRIKVQQPAPPAELEVAFEGLTPARKIGLNQLLADSWKTSFEGRAFVVDGDLERDRSLPADSVKSADCQVYLDGKLIEEVTLTNSFHGRRTPLFWGYDLEPGIHELELRRVGGEAVPGLEYLLIYN